MKQKRESCSGCACSSAIIIPLRVQVLLVIAIRSARCGALSYRLGEY